MAKNKTFKAKKYFQSRVVLDASILLKVFFKEEGSKEIEKLFKMAKKKQLTIITPSLIKFEVLNSLAKNIKDLTKVTERVKKFQRLDLMIMEPENKSTMEALKEATLKKNVTYYDASYHALAKDFDATFITADKKYFDSVENKENIELFA